MSIRDGLFTSIRDGLFMRRDGLFMSFFLVCYGIGLAFFFCFAYGAV
jgi:hypothetical protein